MNRFLQWALAGVAAIAALFLVAALVLPLVIDPAHYREAISSAVRQETGRELDIGDISWTVFPWVGLDVSDLQLSNREGFGDLPMLSVGAAAVSVKLLPLFSRRLEIGGLSLADVSVLLQRREDGKNNWDDLARERAPRAAESPAGGEGLGAFSVSALTVRNANVTWDDAGQLTELKGLGLAAENIEAGRPFRVEGGFSLDLAPSRLAGDASFGGLVRPAVGGPGFAVDGLEAAFKGRQGPAGQALPLDLSLQSNASFDPAGGRASLSDLVVGLNGQVAKGRLEVENFARPRLKFGLRAERLDLDELLSGPPAEAGATGVTAESFRGFNGQGELDVGELRFAGLTATDVRVAISGDGNGVRLFPVNSSFYGGKFHGDVRIDASGARPVLTASQQLTGVEAAALLKDLAGFGRLEGKADFSMAVRTELGDARSSRQALSGDLAASVVDGAIVGIDVTESIRLAQTLLGRQQQAGAQTGADAKTDFSELTVSGRIERGVLRSDDLVLRSPLLRATGKGSIDLAAETIDYVLKPVLVDVLEGQGGQGLANLSGVPVPIRLSGDLFAPDFRLDLASAFAASQKARIASKKDELIGRLTGGRGETGDGDKDGDAAAKKDMAGALLKSIFGGKKDSAGGDEEEEDGR